MSFVTLHFTIGPVQGFIADARRTRDLWAGSFLLSWLTAHAMREIVGQNAHGSETAIVQRGRIVFPAVLGDAKEGIPADPLLAAIQGESGAPHIGSVPNRFKATIDGDLTKAKEAAEACKRAVHAAWKRVADAVWNEFIEKTAKLGAKDLAGDPTVTKAIWDRQVANFWDISWVIGTPVENETTKLRDDGAWLDQRKNWRSHFPSADPAHPQGRYLEGGDHCQLMGLFQEISGYVRARDSGAQDKYWRAIRNKAGPYNFRPGEKLCAIALIKRLFPCLPPEKLKAAIGWVPADRSDRKFSIRNWPSVSYVAAYPWMLAAWSHAKNECVEYEKTIKVLTDGWMPLKGKTVGISDETPISALTAAPAPETGADGDGSTDPGILGWPDGNRPEFANLGGHFFHADAIRSMDPETFSTKEVRDYTPANEINGVLEARRKDAVDALDSLQNEIANKLKAANAPRCPIPRASEFYAVLLVDGDAIGKHLRRPQDGQRPSGEDEARKGLARFTLGSEGDGSDSVERIIHQRHGATIYAGGDDVLALLPLDTAIPAAIALQSAYQIAFGGNQGNRSAGFTMSAAIVFAQYHIPLRAVLGEAHHQLDKVAKEGNGRDSLAISVFKPGGRAFSWVSAWGNQAVSAAVSPPKNLQELVRQLQEDRELSTGFLYNVRERYAPLFPQPEDGASGVAAVLGSNVEADMTRILQAELRAGRSKQTKPGTSPSPDDEALITELMTIALPWRGIAGGTPTRSDLFSFDAGLVMRFMAEEGRWFMETKTGTGGGKP